MLSRLEKRPVSAGQVRAVVLLDTRGRAVKPRRHGETRLYTSDDVAAVRLVLRLRALGVSPTVARVVVACLRDELCQSWHLPLAFAVTGLRGELLSVNQERPAGCVAWVPVRAMWVGLNEAIRARRKVQPEIWQWKAQSASALTATGTM